MDWSFSLRPVSVWKKDSTHNPEQRSPISKALRITDVKDLEFCPISKGEEKERIVRAVILKPGSKHSIEEIAATCYKWMESKDKGQINGVVRILENMISPADITINGLDLKKGSWIMTLKILDDNVWRDFQSGIFNIAGENVQEI